MPTPRFLALFACLLLPLAPHPLRAAISDGLVGYWNFDDGTGTNLVDVSANGSNGELRNFPIDNSQWIAGRIGGALAFDGANDYIYVTNYPKPNTTMTIAAWVWANARPNFATIIKNWPGANQQFHFGLEGTAGDLSNYIKQQGNAQIGPVREGAASPLPLGAWQHVALVCNGATMQIYRNGVAAGSPLAYNGTLQTNPVNASLSIGAKWTSGVTADSFWNGRMDDLGLWNRALSASEILSVCAAGFQGVPLSAAVDGPVVPIVTTPPQGYTRFAGETGPSLTVAAVGTAPLSYQWRQDGTNVPGATAATLAFPGLLTTARGGTYEVVIANSAGSVTSAPAAIVVQAVAAVTDGLSGYWPFDETTGTDAADASGSGNTGALRNYPTDDSQWVPGRVGGALRFWGAGSNHFVFVTNYAKPATTLTIAGWVWAEARPTWGTILKNWPASGQQMHFGIDGTAGDLSNYLMPQGGPQVGPVREGAATPFPTNSWQHVALVCDGSFMRLYRNGTPVGTAVAYNGTVNTNPVNPFLGIGVKLLATGLPATDGSQGFWNGKMDDLALWRRGLTPDEIFSIYRTGTNGNPLPAAPLGSEPIITVQPQGLSRYAGEYAAALSASVVGSAPLAYQWRKDDVDVPGATTASLPLGLIHAGLAGSYTLVITNAFGSVTSAPAVVAVSSVSAIPDALAGYWNFDEGTGALLIDNSGNGNDGALVNFPGDDSQWMAGRIGGALRFGGPASLQYVTVPDYPKPSSTLTITAWVLAEARPTWATLVKNWQTVPGGQFHFGLDNTAGDLSNYLQPANGTQVGPVREGAGAPLPLGTWQHVALVCDGQNMRLYRNGLPVGAPLAYNGTIGTNVQPSLGIGAKLGPGGVPPVSADSGYWHGKIDDLGLWTRGLTADEIFAVFMAGLRNQPLTEAVGGPQAPLLSTDPQGFTRYEGEMAPGLTAGAGGTAPLFYQWRRDGVAIPDATNTTLVLGLVTNGMAGSYTFVATNAGGGATSAPAVVVVQAVTGITEGLAGYWNFDEGAGTLLIDNSGNGNDGALVNYPDDSAWVPGAIGGSLAFGGQASGQHVVVPNYPKPSSTLTLSAWVLATSRPTWATIAKNWPATGQQFHFGLDNNTGDLSNYLLPQGGAQVGPVREGSGTPLPTNSWQHVALVCNGATMQLYRNGQPAGAPLAYNGTINTNLASQALGIGVKLVTNAVPDTAVPGYWHGRMDDLGLWTRGLSAAEIAAIYRAGCGAFPLSEADPAALPPVFTQEPAAQTNYTGTTATFTAAATAGGGEVRYFWLFNGLVLPGATGSTLTLPGLTLGQAGDYRAVAAGVGGCVTGAVATLTVLPNSPPVAGDGDAATPLDTPLAILHGKLLAGCSDPDLDPLTISAAGPLSTNGAAVTLNGSHVIYTPVPGFIGVDRFAFTVTDGKGGFASATVQVGVYNAGEGYNRVTFSVSGGQVHLGYAGIPGFTYTIERTPALDPATWSVLGTATADALGHLSFTDTNPPPGSAYYRTRYP